MPSSKTARTKDTVRQPRPPKWLEEAYGGVPLPISVTHDQRLVWVNPEFERFYACRLNAIRGRQIKDVVVTSDQLAEQDVDIQHLNAALKAAGLGIRHFRNQSQGQEVGVLVLAFSVHHRGVEFRVGIAIPDNSNDLFRLLVRHLLVPGFNVEAFVAQLTERQRELLRDFGNPSETAKQQGETGPRTEPMT